MRHWWQFARLGCACALVAGAVQAQPAVPMFEVFDDGRDHYTLLDRHFANRQLFSELEIPSQRYRLGRELGRFALASDLAVGTEQTPDGSPQARFHGYYLADTFVAARLIDGLEANLNLLLFNPSASDGYRVSSQIAAGLALHFHQKLFQIGDRPLGIDVVGTDLGWVTLGSGLLIEQVPLEGVTGRVWYGPLSYYYTYLGRVFWPDDDVIRNEINLFDGRLGLMLVNWQKKEGDRGGIAGLVDLLDENRPRRPIAIENYVSGYIDVPIGDHFHFAGEYAVHLDERPKSAGLLRSDYVGRHPDWLEAHVGYQFRYYERGFGPRDAFVPTTVPWNLPYQEDIYVTSSFEYLDNSTLFEQWSHTLMVEARIHVGARLELFGETELWLRTNLTPFDEPVSIFPPELWIPTHRLEPFYRVGATFKPFARFPHRANAFLTNKQVNGAPLASGLLFDRFQPGTYYVVELEAFL